MLRLFYFIILMEVALFSMSQVSVRGTIIDGKTNFPVEGATVILLPSKLSTITDEFACSHLFTIHVTT